MNLLLSLQTLFHPLNLRPPHIPFGSAIISGGPFTPVNCDTAVAMMSMLRAAAQSVTGAGAARLRGSAFLGAPRAPLVLAAPIAPARPYRYTPPVQVRS